MIGFIRGTVFAFGTDWVLIDVQGVGYRIAFYHPEKLKINEEVLIYTYQNVREDELSLFGFTTLAEYDLFVQLISVKGLGPKTACGILARASVAEIERAIAEEDAAFMKKMPGIGARTAQQIILDLKGKLVSLPNKEEKDPLLQSVSDALKSLGYRQNEIDSVLPKCHGEKDLNSCIKKALMLLAR